MAISTYSELKTAIANWLKRSSLTDRIPEFIELAEATLRRELEVPDTETSTTLTATAGTATVALPSGFGRMRSLNVTSGGANYPLNYLSPTVFYSSYAGTVSGVPDSYTIIGTNIVLGPTPDSAYSLPIIYFAKLTSLSDSAPTNWLLTSHPDAYLYTALVSAADYLGSDKRLTTWASLASQAIESVNEQADERQAGGTMVTQVDGSTP